MTNCLSWFRLGLPLTLLWWSSTCPTTRSGTKEHESYLSFWLKTKWWLISILETTQLGLMVLDIWLRLWSWTLLCSFWVWSWMRLMIRLGLNFSRTWHSIQTWRCWTSRLTCCRRCRCVRFVFTCRVLTLCNRFTWAVITLVRVTCLWFVILCRLIRVVRRSRRANSWRFVCDVVI